jgi:hypothetical protein
MREIFRNNELSIVLFALFFFSLVGQYFTSYQEYNDDRQSHGKRKSVTPNISAKDILSKPYLKIEKANFCKWGCMLY